MKEHCLRAFFSLAGVLSLLETNSLLYLLRASYHVSINLLVRIFVHLSFCRKIVWYIDSYLIVQEGLLSDVQSTRNRIRSIHISYTYQKLSNLNIKNFLSKRFEIQIHSLSVRASVYLSVKSGSDMR